MSQKSLFCMSGLLTLLAAFLMTSAAMGGSDAATVSITATVDTFAEWSDNSPAIAATDWPGHITAVNQTRLVTKVLTLYTNGAATITPTAGTNSGVLTHPTLASQTLATSYQITGDVTVPDVAYKAAGAGAGEFFEATNTYTVAQVAETGTYTVNLLVKAVSPAVAPDAGNYTCGVVLTASW